MSGKNTAVFGIYPTDERAGAAADTLRTKGFRSSDVSTLFTRNSGSKEFGHGKGTKPAEGALPGEETGALIGLGISQDQGKRYAGRMRRGGILLSVHADDQEWASKGKQILEQTGAEDISSTEGTKEDAFTCP
jgi:hypothetical protein